jgi:hypothetical protein
MSENKSVTVGMKQKPTNLLEVRIPVIKEIQWQQIFVRNCGSWNSVNKTWFLLKIKYLK